MFRSLLDDSHTDNAGQYYTWPNQVLFFFSFCLFRATPTAYGGSQAMGPIGAVATGLHHSHSNARSGPLLSPTPQLTATLDL